jgi:alkylation response protein AidB-like acyl-CoA dehydrogenase
MIEASKSPLAKSLSAGQLVKLGAVAQQIRVGRLLVMHAAWKLDQGERARKEVSMAKVHVADALHQAADVARGTGCKANYSARSN